MISRRTVGFWVGALATAGVGALVSDIWETAPVAAIITSLFTGFMTAVSIYYEG